MKKKSTSTQKELGWYEMMLLMRRFEEKVAQLYGQQKIRGFCHLYTGQEACAMGAVAALGKGDKYITAYRDHALPLALGTSAEKIMAELYGKKTGCSAGKGGSMHIFDFSSNFYGGHGIVGGQIPLAAGLAFAEKYNKTNHLCICFIGDGAVRQGSFHETLNLAMLYQLPVIFAIENNGYSMGTSVERTSNVRELFRLGASYDMPAEGVDGMSVHEVYRAVSKAATRARKGQGPSLIELRTYRYKGHSMSDPAQYRTKEEVKSYQQRDPIARLESELLKKKLMTKEQLAALDKEVREQVKEAVAFAEASPYPEANEAFHHVYAADDYPFITE